MKTRTFGKFILGLLGTLCITTLASSQAQAAATWISCTPTQSMVYSNRVHVKCATAVNGIYYFAASTSDANFATRILTTANTGVVSGRTLNVLYDPADLSGSAIGCANSDCRLISAIGLK